MLCLWCAIYCALLTMNTNTLEKQRKRPLPVVRYLPRPVDSYRTHKHSVSQERRLAQVQKHPTSAQLSLDVTVVL